MTTPGDETIKGPGSGGGSFLQELTVTTARQDVWLMFLGTTQDCDARHIMDAIRECIE